MTNIFEEIKEFSKKVSREGILVGIDYGAKKIGLAISSPNWSMSLPFLILSNDEKLFGNIETSLKGKSISGFVIGLPVNMDGSESNSSKNVREFAEKLYAKFLITIYLQDERRTSRAADSLLKMAGYARKERNEIDDSIAAHLILESAISNLNSI